MAAGTPRRLCLAHSPFNGAYFCRAGTDHFRSSGEEIWKSIWNEQKVIAWSYWLWAPTLYPRLNTLLACAGAVETMPSHGPHGKSFNLLRVKSLFLQERNNLLRCHAIYIFFGGRGGGGQIVLGNRGKIMPIVSCFKRLSIYICISFHKLGLARHSTRRKKLLL